jgi:NADH dehydrogenase FAD-containing subunit
MATRVAIIGGGFAGCKIAQLLLAEPSFRVTLIDPTDFFEMTWVNLRGMVNPEWAQRSIVPYTTFLPGIQHIKDEATSLEAKRLVTKSGQAVDFDFCVIAVGSSYAGFLKAAPSTSTSAQRLAEIHAHSVRIKDAAQVLIVGGGPSGVELAFEILDVYPGKKVARLACFAVFLARCACLKHPSDHSRPFPRSPLTRINHSRQRIRSRTPHRARCRCAFEH